MPKEHNISKVVAFWDRLVSKDPSPNSKDSPTSNGPTKKPKPGQTKVEDVPKPKEVDVKDPNAIRNVPT